MTELTPAQFSKTLPHVPQNGGECAVLFKMNGCGWCEKMVPEWEKLNGEIGFMQLFTFTVNDSTENENHWKKIVKSLKNSDQLQGFPIVMLYSKTGRVVVYPGYEDAKDMKAKMIQFVEQK